MEICLKTAAERWKPPGRFRLVYRRRLCANRHERADRTGFRAMELAVSGLRLIGDIGGTNARFAVAENGAYRGLKHVEVDRYPSLHDALSDYLKTLTEAERSNLAGALAIAGPVLGDKISMTNKAWSFSVEELKRSLNLTSLAVVNDFAATARSIPHIAPSNLFPVGPAITD